VPRNSSRVHTKFDEGRLAASKTSWSTEVNGIYPARELISNGTQFTTCPISTSWCVTPSSIAVVDLNFSSYYLNLTTVSASCVDYLEFGVALVNGAFLGNASYDFSPCSVIHDSFNNVSFNCNVTSQLNYMNTTVLKDSTNATELNIYVGTRVRSRKALVASDNEFGVVREVEPAVIRIYSKWEEDGINCDTNIVVYEGQSSCELCQSSILSSACPSMGIYTYPVCLDANCSQSRYLDGNTCCDISEIDCFGLCFGTAVIAAAKSGIFECCPVSDVDCSGVCYGSATSDVCGVCNGLSTNSALCSNDQDSRLQFGSPWPMFGRNVHHQVSSPFIFQLTDTIMETAICNATQSSPIIDNQGTIYFGCDDGYVYAVVESPVGTVAAEEVPVVRGKFAVSGAVRTTAAIDVNGVLYFGTTAGVFYAVDALLFETIWTHSMLCCCMIAPPALYGGYVFFVGVWMETDIGQLCALSTADGKVLWSVNISEAIYSSAPLLADGKVFIHAADAVIIAHDMGTGQYLFAVQLDSDEFTEGLPSDVNTISAPCRLPDKSIVAVSRSGTVVRFTVNGDEITVIYNISLARPVYSTLLVHVSTKQLIVNSYYGDILSLDLYTGVRLWQSNINGLIVSTGAMSENSDMYFVAADAAIYAFNLTNGEMLNTITLPYSLMNGNLLGHSMSVNGLASNIAVDADGTIVYTTADGRLVRIGNSFSTCPAGSGITSALNSTTVSVANTDMYCSACDIGYHSSRSICSPCTPGYFTNVTGVTRCAACSAGDYVSSYVSVSCGACPVGMYSDQGETACTHCEAGKYASTERTANGCMSCGSGKFSASTASTKCDSCGLGYTSAAVGSTGCVSCGAGSYGAYLDNISDHGAGCLLCPANTYSSLTASTYCTPCSAGEYTAVAGSTECISCIEGKFYDLTQNSCRYCSWPRFPSQSSDSKCSYYLLAPQNRIGVAVNIAYLIFFVCSVSLLVCSIDIRLTAVELNAGFVITRFGVVLALLPCWIEQFLQILYVLNVPFTNLPAFLCFIAFRFGYQYMATLVMIRCVTGSWQAVIQRYRKLIRLVPIGGGLFLLKGFALRNIYNNYFRAVTNNRNCDYRTSPIVVEFFNFSSFANSWFQTLPLLVIVLTSTDANDLWYRQLIFVLYLIAAVYSAFPVLRLCRKGDDYTVATNPIVIKLGHTWLAVRGDSDGLSTMTQLTYVSARARPVAVNDYSYANTPVAVAQHRQAAAAGNGSDDVHEFFEAEIVGGIDATTAQTGTPEGTPDELGVRLYGEGSFSPNSSFIAEPLTAASPGALSLFGHGFHLPLRHQYNDIPVAEEILSQEDQNSPTNVRL
jgi:outer membrane protein assembly factor BamB